MSVLRLNDTQPSVYFELAFDLLQHEGIALAMAELQGLLPPGPQVERERSPLMILFAGKAALNQTPAQARIVFPNLEVFLSEER